MVRIILISMICCLSLPLSSVWAQKAERDFVRKGNRAYKDSAYVDAEINYRKALDVDPRSTEAMFNLGNALLHQNKVQEAMKLFVSAANVEKNKMNLAQISHNMGVVCQSQKVYVKAVEAYKLELRNNPKDDETRYNLALAQKMLKNQQQNQQQNQQEQQEQDEKKQQNQQEQKEQTQDQQEQKEQQQQNQMSKENAEQLLKSVMQDEKDTQDKVKKQQQTIQSGRLEKDW